MSVNATSNQLFTLFKAIADRVHPNSGGTIDANEAYNGYLDIKNERPDLINVLPQDIKDKLKNGLTSDLFNVMDPLGVTDGKINQEEFAKGLEKGTAEDDANINLGDHDRGKGATNDCMIHGIYAVKNPDGKYSARNTATNVINDFENIMQGTPGSTVDGKIGKAELQSIVQKYTAAGQPDRAKTAEFLLDYYAAYKSQKGDYVDVDSITAGLTNPWFNTEAPAQWE